MSHRLSHIWRLSAVLLMLGAMATEHFTALASAQSEQIERGSFTWTVESGTDERSVRMYIPESVDLSNPVPLVVMLHGGFGSAKQAESAYEWDAMADIGGFVVAFPNGDGRAWNAGGGCCGEPGRTGRDDV